MALHIKIAIFKDEKKKICERWGEKERNRQRKERKKHGWRKTLHSKKVKTETQTVVEEWLYRLILHNIIKSCFCVQIDSEQSAVESS